eukprot:scaffold107842_cov69-Phaeocystis_antarctica.AAC.3
MALGLARTHSFFQTAPSANFICIESARASSSAGPPLELKSIRRSRPLVLPCTVHFLPSSSVPDIVTNLPDFDTLRAQPTCLPDSTVYLPLKFSGGAVESASCFATDASTPTNSLYASATVGAATMGMRAAARARAARRPSGLRSTGLVTRPEQPQTSRSNAVLSASILVRTRNV